MTEQSTALTSTLPTTTTSVTVPGTLTTPAAKSENFGKLFPHKNHTAADERNAQVLETPTKYKHAVNAKQNQKHINPGYGRQTRMFPRNYFKFRRFHSKETMPGKAQRRHFQRKNWQRWPRLPKWNFRKQYKLQRRNIPKQTKTIFHDTAQDIDSNMTSNLNSINDSSTSEPNNTGKQQSKDSGDPSNLAKPIIYRSTSKHTVTIPTNSNIISYTNSMMSSLPTPIKHVQTPPTTELPSINTLFLKTDPKMYGPPSVSSDSFPDYNLEKWFFKHLFGVDLPYLRKSAKTMFNETSQSTGNGYLETSSNTVNNETLNNKDSSNVSVMTDHFATTNQETTDVEDQVDILTGTTFSNMDINTLMSLNYTTGQKIVAINETKKEMKVTSSSETEDGSNRSFSHTEVLLPTTLEATTTKILVTSKETILNTFSPLKYEYKKINKINDTVSEQPKPIQNRKNVPIKSKKNIYNNYIQNRFQNMYKKPSTFQKEKQSITNYNYKINARNRYNYRDRKPNTWYNSGNWILPHKIHTPRNFPNKLNKDQMQKTYPEQPKENPHKHMNQSLKTDKNINKTDKTITSSQNSSPLAQSEDHPKIRLGSKEFSGIVGGSASLVLLILVAALVTSFHKRCNKSHKKKRRTYGNSKKKKFNDIILAYESSEGDASPNSLSSISNISFNEDRGFPHLHTAMPYSGNINSSLDSHGHKRSLLDHMDMLKTIDERPEDIYSHFKFSKTKWLKQKLAKKPKYSQHKHISKSADNLSDLYPSLERRLSVSVVKNNRKSCGKSKLLPFQKGFAVEKIIKKKSDKSDVMSEAAKLTDSMDDTLEGLSYDFAKNFINTNTKCNVSQQTSGSLLRKSKSEPDLVMKHQQSDFLQQEFPANLQPSNENTGTGEQKIINMSKDFNIQTEDDTLDTDNMSSIIDFTSPNSEKPMHSDVSGEMPSTFTHVTEYENPEGHYSSLDEAQKYLWEKRGESPYLYEPVYQQIPDNVERNVVLTSFTNTSDDTEHDIPDAKDNLYENAKDRETFKYSKSIPNNINRKLEIKCQEKDYATISYPEEKHKSKRPTSLDKNKKTKSRNKCHNKSSDNSKYGNSKNKNKKSKRQTIEEEKHPKHQRKTSWSEDDRLSFDSLRRSHEYHKQRAKTQVQTPSTINSETYHTKPPLNSNHQILDHLERNGDISTGTLHKILLTNPDYSHIDLSTMMSQNELTSDSLDLSFHRTHMNQDYPSLTQQNIVQMLAQQYYNDNTACPRKHGKNSQRPSKSSHNSKVQRDSTPHFASHKKYSDLGDITCSPYSTIRTINARTLQQNQGTENKQSTKESKISHESVMLQKHDYLPNDPFLSKHCPATYNGQNNWRNFLPRNIDADIERNVKEHNSKHVRGGHHIAATNNLSVPMDGPVKHFLLCSTESPDVCRSAHHSNASSQRSRKSHATLYSDIMDIEGIYMPKSVPHSHGDISL